jgi:hypothetical protein
VESLPDRHPFASLDLTVRRNVIAGWVLRALGVLCLLIPLAWLFSEGLPSLGGTIFILIFFAPLWVCGLLALSTARRLQGAGGHVMALVLLLLALFVSWAIAWESQMFEPAMRFADREGTSNGIRPPATWNEGRVGFALLAATSALGAGALIASSWGSVPVRTRRALGAILAITLVALAASIPVLRARERARAERAISECRAFLDARGSDREERRSRCADPFDEPFVSER